MGLSDVTRLRLAIDELRSLDSRLGGGFAVDPALGALAQGVGLLSQCGDEVRPELELALADLSNTVAWAHHDAGQQQQARLHLAQGLGWALDSGTITGFGLAADLFFGLARVELHEGDPGTALKMVQLGQIAAADAHDIGAAAQLQATAAWAYALIGQHRQMADSLARAEHEMSLVDPHSSEPWMKVFFSGGGYLGHQALVHGVLAANTDDPAIAAASATRATELTTTSLTLSGPDRPARSLLFDRIVAATNNFRVGDLDTAITLTHRAVADLEEIATQRGIQRLPEIVVAATPHSSDSAVAEVMHQVEVLVSS
ncbi:hypothetical protein [Nocardia sp. R7R-8]|uniref:hypothetical protein n=1 Tax=Nocardia sp. R7R-8 TaxID=3459304 RepID=UPI00403DB633